jgi:hypothetical protein
VCADKAAGNATKGLKPVQQSIIDAVKSGKLGQPVPVAR